MNLLASLSIVSLVVAVALGFKVLASNPKDPINRIFVWACVLTAYTAFTNLGFYVAGDLQTAREWSQASAFWLLLISALLHFAVAFTTKLKHSEKWWLYVLIYVPALIFAILDFSINVFEAQVIQQSWGWFYQIGTGPGVIIFTVWLTATIFISVLMLWRYYRSAETSIEQKQQIRAITSFITYIAVIGLITDLFLQFFDVIIPRITTMNFTIGSLFVWYGILKHRLFALPLQQQTEVILATMSDLVFICDLNCKIIKANRAASDVLGYGEKELVGRDMKSIVYVDSDDQCDMMQAGETRDRASTFVTKNNSYLPLSLSVSYIHDAAGNVISYVAVARDMSERVEQAELTRKYLERERALSQKLKEQIDSRVEYTNALVHELKTPLTSVIASSGLLEAEASDDITKRLATNILKGARNLDRRVGELLDLAKDELGMLVFDKKPMDFTVLMRDVCDSYAELATRTKVSLELDNVYDIPHIIADRDRLEQVIQNLLTNAFKWTPGGGRISVSAARDNGSIKVEVADTGAGIPTDRLERIFERYYIAEDDGQMLSGLGIGLSLAKSIVEAHGGRIWAESEQSKGSKLTFVLPIKDDADAKAQV